MISALAVVALPWALCTGVPANAPVRVPVPGDSLAVVYREALSWDSYLAMADARKELWERNWRQAEVPADLLERARAAAGPWRILAITEFRCSDSVNTLPFLAKLAESVPGIELRAVNSTVGRFWMEAHRSPDGRAATPTFLLLDEEYRIRGCWVEQPAALQSFWLEIVARRAESAEIRRKMEWYEGDRGGETLREFVEILEAAQRGETICPGAADG
jgi:hypothetical protein